MNTENFPNGSADDSADNVMPSSATDTSEPLPLASGATLAKASYLTLALQALRSLVMLPPRWQQIPSSAVAMMILLVLSILINCTIERLAIIGPANFYWPAIGSGWYGYAILGWISYVTASKMRCADDGQTAPSAAQLFVFLMAQVLMIELLICPFYLMTVRSTSFAELSSAIGQWAIYLVVVIWLMTAQLRLIWRAGSGNKTRFAWAIVALMLSIALGLASSNIRFWYPKRTETTAPEEKTLELTQTVMEAQPVLLKKNLDAVLPERPGVIDLYSITFAPYGSENVFLNETKVVNEVMATRFDAQGRGVRLINHLDTLDQYPWATPLNLQRSINQIAATMNKDEDILFIHLTSHGASDGELAADFWPMKVDTIRPTDLRAWLDQAGIKHRVISISACYAGNWIEPLANDDSLVMTASDADHTSYGCGRKSELTFFGRAMYDELLRNKTLSFEAAFAEARPLIKVREEKEGKDDGYSNPQIKEGSAIRSYLAEFVQQLQQRAH